ncbi:MAG TPA: energy transducer TonB [Fluviicola sp.]|nr:energy transducer TonB [Fluviicola sp.]
MKVIFVALLVFQSLDLWSQEPPKTGALAAPAKEEIFYVCDLGAEFPGGHAALRKFLAENIQYPKRLSEMSYMAKVYVRFVVTAEGKIVAPEILRGAVDCPECDEEVLRVVKLMPDWIPAKIQGKPVNSYFTLPVKFGYY